MALLGIDLSHESCNLRLRRTQDCDGTTVRHDWTVYSFVFINISPGIILNDKENCDKGGGPQNDISL